jgi:two-component sensor histidine kinase
MVGPECKLAEPAHDIYALRAALDDAHDRVAWSEHRLAEMQFRLDEADARARLAEARAEAAERRALAADTHTALCEARSRNLMAVARRFRTLVANIPDTLVVVFDRDLRYQVVEGPAARAAYRDPGSMEGRTLSELFPPEVVARLEPLYRRTLAGEGGAPIEIEDQERSYVVHFRPLRDENDEVTGGMVLSQDVTRLKQTEADLRRKQAALEGALREREVLLREVYHRVKNNLQAVSSLLSLQARAVVDPAAREALLACRERVGAMARVHERLYRSDDVGRIALGPYVQELVQQVGATYRHLGAVEVRVEAPERVEVDLETAIPCGLIVHELAANSLKHAWPHGGPGLLLVQVQDEGDQIVISVEDDGVGAPWGPAPVGRTLGTRLVASLTAQLGACLERTPGPGTRYRLKFAARGAR